ncbi:nucleoside triphosphate pyrophosphohydrolase [Patescibacteria group bacterium]|nr:nucleoside triphosphate pyrophosphohydrolase [Patescibacteria group bacterium]MBU1500545.1 nucleoside triphosphate pyrophosphohydrolase [Patescibacteria group bacterium]MBU2080434.1 nucleoside triphosphate pyrophosphohydrolase [Patescibacteria group bacterium]MBU2123761.1 nucleoside triphosphate pyrophosphohydrolase [Patescibacteria group bacterium]MBU2194617.1 nucleoside triphosphate pyrophosphohydrolase [Patescibacteria group bacterium]
MSHYRKLVRDNIPQILDEKGVSYTQTIADDTEYKKELIKKLLEEATEFAEQSSVEELADVLEVVAALKKLEEYADVEAVCLDKREERGGFEKRIILEGEK